MKRIDVPWGPNALDRAAQALVEHMGEQAGQFWFVLPAKRGVRQFQEALARHLPAHREPPRGVGQGAWLDALRPTALPAVDRREAAHVWSACLRELGANELRRALGQERPQADAATEWLTLGQRVRDLHAEVVQAGRSFELLLAEFPEAAARWKVWVALHQRYQALLAERGLCDGLDERPRATLASEGQVAMVMVPTATEVERETLRELGPRAVALVLCDREHAQGMDEQGFLRPEFWAHRHLPFAATPWRVVDDPRQQAEAAFEVLAQWSQAQPTHPSDLVLAAPDGDSKPFLARRLASLPARLHDAAGQPLGDTQVAELLRATGALLPAWRYQDAARLLRHPGVYAWLQAAAQDGQDPGPVALSDAYQARHFPMHLQGLQGSQAGQRLQVYWDRLQGTLSECLPAGRRPLPQWAQGLHAWLSAVYGERTWDETSEAQGAERAALEACAAVLTRWQASEAPWWPEVSAAAACQLLASEVQAQTAPVGAPVEAEEGRVTLELLGWHELLWDDAPDLIVTGFQEGAVPEAIPMDPLLTPSQRRKLGLPDSERRAARDVYLLHALLRCRSRVALISGRKRADGEPVRPSRFAFHRPDDEIIPALQKAFPAEESLPPAAPAQEDAAAQRPLPKLDSPPVLKTIAATDFQAYLNSPYLYYLQRLLKLDSVDDRGREMDGRAFGTLAHKVLERFGRSAQRHSQDAEAIESVLMGELDREVARHFGDNTLPAVRLQLEGLRTRLRWFARRQALWAAEGWRIQEVEWSPGQEGLPMWHGDPPVSLVGSIDRIDVHPTEGFAILDYKTGDAGKKPSQTHGPNKAGDWKDLQLPMYRHLARELAGDRPVRLGYFTLGKDPSAVDLHWGTWDEDALAEADALAATIVQRIQAGEFEHLHRARVQDPIFQALTGEALVGVAEGEEESDAEEKA